jgi:hypothetical protein
MTARIDRQDGQFVIPADLIADAFGLDPAAVPGMMRDGRITSRSERGIDADAGRWRLTLYCGDRAFRLTVDDTGLILSRSRFAAARRGPAAG